jgi:hypothetical protein
MKATASLRPCAVWLLVACSSALASADQAKESAVDPAKPAELKVLDRLIGTWTDEATLKVPASTPKEERERSNTRIEWSGNGWFVQIRDRSTDGKRDDLQVLTFDPKKKVFRRWYFYSYGNVSEATGQWDDKTNMLTWTGDNLGDGLTAVSVWKFTDDKTLVWSRIIKDRNGRVNSVIEGKSVREK